jgi:ferrochelatase
MAQTASKSATMSGYQQTHRITDMQDKAVLLVNLGSPEAPEIPQVRQYLKQFLMDPYVIQLPWVLRAIIVYLLVLPKRPAASAHAYQSIWTDQGSPLIVLSKQLQAALQSRTDRPVRLAMRYGEPSIESQLSELAAEKNIKDVLVIPLYPQFAESTVSTVVEEVKRSIRDRQLGITFSVLPPFYNNGSYIKALVESAAEQLKQPFDHVLFSYHGLPELHITRADPTGSHCLKSDNCCSTLSPAHATCYRHQVISTTQAFVKEAGLEDGQYSIAYQSRLGRAKWLEPSTEETLVKLAQQGVKRLLVLCPAFVTDCLETLEEIKLQGRETFLQAGGEELIYLPCLNDNPAWVDCLADWIGNSAIPDTVMT